MVQPAFIKGTPEASDYRFQILVSVEVYFSPVAFNGRCVGTGGNSLGLVIVWFNLEEKGMEGEL